jgi:hypothetical protein
MSRPLFGEERRGHRIVAWALAILLGSLAARVAHHAYDHLPRPRPLEELSYFPSGESLRPLALGHPETLADVAWLRTVQYYGEHRLSDNRFFRMAHLFDVLTTLAPRFEAAYVFGAFALAQEGLDFPAAERLMKKGLDANPRSGYLAFQLGFLYYVMPGGRDLDNAARYFEQASRQADGPPQSLRFAAFARQRAGDARVAYELWRQLSEQSGNHYLRKIAEREMAAIQEAWQAGRTAPQRRAMPSPRVILKRGGLQ